MTKYQIFKEMLKLYIIYYFKINFIKLYKKFEII